MGNSKIIYAGETLLDLTADTVTPEALLMGVSAHGADGEIVVGTLDLRAISCVLPASGWEVQQGHYRQSVSIEGMTADWKPGIPVLESSADLYRDLEMLEESRHIQFIASEEGCLTFCCAEKCPRVDILLTVPRIFV